MTWPPAGVDWYYSDEYTAIACGDCREVLPLLPKVDLCLTDPPYGIGYQSNARLNKFDTILNDESMFLEWLPLCRAERFAVFTRWDVLEQWTNALGAISSVRGCIVWHKDQSGMGDLIHAYAPDYELILYTSESTWKLPGKRYGSVWKCPPESAMAYQHPTQKPEGIMRLCVERFSSSGLILDPFMGSGTTLVAAKSLGRKSIGVEISERYAAVAVERLRQEYLPLFNEPDAPPAEPPELFTMEDTQ